MESYDLVVDLSVKNAANGKEVVGFTLREGAVSKADTFSLETELLNVVLARFEVAKKNAEV